MAMSEISHFHAAHPWLEESRQALIDAEIDVFDYDLDGPLIDRAIERVVGMVSGEDTDPLAEPSHECAAYAFGRVLVSLVNNRYTLDRYARGEARAAYAAVKRAEDRARSGRTLQSVRSVDRAALRTELGLDDAVAEYDDGLHVDVVPYLYVATETNDERWKPVQRMVHQGAVHVPASDIDEFYELALVHHIRSRLPRPVPSSVESALSDATTRLKRELGDHLKEFREITSVVPEEFPPCMAALLDAVKTGEHLPHEARFALGAFLVNLNMSTDEIVEMLGVNPGFAEDETRYQVEHIKSGGSDGEPYTPPACATMQTHGLCVNKDELCESISHPLAYYRRRLDAIDTEDESGTEVEA